MVDSFQIFTNVSTVTRSDLFTRFYFVSFVCNCSRYCSRLSQFYQHFYSNDLIFYLIRSRSTILVPGKYSFTPNPFQVMFYSNIRQETVTVVYFQISSNFSTVTSLICSRGFIQSACEWQNLLLAL